jgi:hypothetical protein
LKGADTGPQVEAAETGTKGKAGFLWLALIFNADRQIHLTSAIIWSHQPKASRPGMKNHFPTA